MTLPTVPLNDCPIGLFLARDGELCVMTEYAKQEKGGPAQRDAYIVSSGEYFWGGAKTTAERGAVPVTPLAIDDLMPEFWHQYAYQPANE